MHIRLPASVLNGSLFASFAGSRGFESRIPAHVSRQIKEDGFECPNITDIMRKRQQTPIKMTLTRKLYIREHISTLRLVSDIQVCIN